MSEVRSLRLVCTGRGRHKPRLMYVWRIHVPVDSLTVGTFAPLPGSWFEPTPCTALLPAGDACGFAPRIGTDTLTEEFGEAIEKLKAGEWSVTLDISESNI